MRPHQRMQLIAVDDIGKVAAAVFADPERFASRTVAIAGAELSGKDLQEQLSRAVGGVTTYQRFPDSVFEQDAFLGRLGALVDAGRVAGAADFERLRQEFPGLLTFEEWLDGPGKPSLQAALEAQNTTVALR